jgi:tetratricopeptide (TPR) repeat protein
MSARRIRLPTLTLAVAVLAPLATVPLPAAVEPFYLNLYRSGIHHYDLGDAATARYELRLACFGMLDDPEQLAECLARLALAQAASEDDVGFADTFRRIADLEQRFGAWSGTALDGETRAKFDQLVLAKVPAGTLAVSPGFSGLRTANLRRELASLPPAEQRARLDQRLAASPRDLALLLVAAEVALAQGDAVAADAYLEAARSVDPRDATVRCLLARRALAAAGAGAGCAAWRADLAACPAVGQEVEATRQALVCALDGSDFALAQRIVARSTPAVRSASEIVALLARIPAAAPSAGDAPPSAAAGAPSPAREGAATSAAPVASPPQATLGPRPEGRPVSGPAGLGVDPPASPSPALPTPGSAAVTPDSTLASLRQRLAAAANAADAVGLLAEAEALASSRPERSDLWHFAAEIAYRGSRWTDVVRLIERGGSPAPNAAALGFYYAVALYETGQRDAAARAIERALPGLQRTPFVDGYVARILAAGGGAS